MKVKETIALIMVLAIVGLHGESRGCGNSFGRYACKLTPESSLTDIVRVFSETACQEKCRAERKCRFYSYFYRTRRCRLFQKCSAKEKCTSCISGTTTPDAKFCRAGCSRFMLNFECALNYANVLSFSEAKNAQTCQNRCKKSKKCRYFTFSRENDNRICYLMKRCKTKNANDMSISGPEWPLVEPCLPSKDFPEPSTMLLGGLNNKRKVMSTVEVVNASFLNRFCPLLPNFAAKSYAAASELVGGAIIRCGGVVNHDLVSDCWKLDLLNQAEGTLIWKAFKSLKTKRAYHTSFYIRDQLFMMNGYYNSWSSVTNTIEVYSEQVGWTEMPHYKMITPTQGHCTVQVKDRYVFRIGGRGTKGPYLNSAEVLDIETGEVRMLESMTEGKYSPLCGVTEVKNKLKILAVSGFFSRSVEQFDIETEKWTNLERNKMFHFRGYLNLFNGSPTVIGGMQFRKNVGNMSTEVYDGEHWNTVETKYNPKSLQAEMVKVDNHLLQNHCL